MNERRSTMLDRPMRVWRYRGWCWICRICKGCGWGLHTQSEALAQAWAHCREWQR